MRPAISPFLAVDDKSLLRSAKLISQEVPLAFWNWMATDTAFDFITKIPPEILGEIFYHCTLFYPDAPLRLSSVCRSFYHTARVSPQIWGRLRLSLSENAHTNKRATRKARLWLSMGGVCPVHIYVEIPKTSSILDKIDSPVHSRNVKTPLLSFLLRYHKERIRSLILRTYTESQAHSFLDSIYAPSSLNVPAKEAPALQKLTLIVTSNLPSIGEQRLPASFPFLSSLNFLKLTSPVIPNLTAANLANLQTLVIIRPIRSHPLKLKPIIHVLHASPVLVHFELETRIDSPAGSMPSLNLIEDDHITMSTLAHLSLRTNNNPVLLNYLVTPGLHSLHLDELDGKKLGRAEATAVALSMMLMRMDCASSKERSIEILELAGVSIHRSPRGQNELWEWCFRNMKALRCVIARNMDAEHLVELLTQGADTSSASNHRSNGSHSFPNNLICPCLEYFVVSAPEMSDTMMTFKAARPNVNVFALGYTGSAMEVQNNQVTLKSKSRASVAGSSTAINNLGPDHILLPIGSVTEPDGGPSTAQWSTLIPGGFGF